jgi:transcription antitermination factor NusG
MLESTLSQPPRPTIASASGAAEWFAVRVKTTHEKRVAALLDHKGYEHFLPLYLDRRRWSDRIKEVELPLFPGYIFCRFEPNARLGILKTPGVYRILGIGNLPAPVDEHEIAAIQLAMSSGLCARPHPYLAVGQRVRVEGGSLSGVEGLIVDIRSRDRLILSISLLQRSIALEIDSAWVSPLSEQTTN